MDILNPCDLEAYPFPLRLKRSVRAKRVRLTVKTSGVECVMPVNFPESQALAFIHQQREWLVTKYREAVARVPASTFWEELTIGREVTLPFQGRNLPLRVTGSAGTRSRLRFADEVFHLQLPDEHRGRWNALSERTLFVWSRSWLAHRAGELVRQHQGRANLLPRYIRIKRMRTRWGSCGGHNDINLNWLLTLAPPSVLEYVVVHELCHIRHRDHSGRFWALVADHVPDYPRERQWLKNEGRTLMLRFGEVRE